MKKRLQAAIAAIVVLGTLSLHAQTDTSAPPTKTAKTKRANAAAEKKAEEAPEQKAIRELQEKLAAQQAQIDALTQQNAAKDAALSSAQSTAASAQSTAASAASQAAAAAAQAQSASSSAQTSTDAVTAVKSDVSDLKTANAGLATTINDTKKDLNDKIDSAPAIHYKGVTITPGGFVAFEGVRRERSVNSDINTPYNSIPFPGANEGHTSEMNFSGRQSRVTMLVQGDTGPVKLAGYYEVDWLGSGTTSNNNESNSYVLRQRQIWGQGAYKNGFTITGGQMWSLTTEDRHGLDPLTEIQPLTIDPQYLVGYTWERQPELRLEQHFGNYKTNALTIGMSVEQAQITGFTANGTNPAEYFFGGTGQSGGLYNAAGAAGNGNTASTGAITTYANNVAPDFVVKAAYDNPFFHAELGGIARFLRNDYYPVTTTFTTPGTPIYAYGPNLTSHTSDAGGVFGAMRSYIGRPGTYPAVEVAVTGMAGTGIGRYGDAQLADATLRPDETLEPIRSYHGLLSIESHLNPKFDAFAYYGGEYAQRTVYATAAGNLIGYGPNNLNDSGCYNEPAFGSGSPGTGGSISAPNCGSPTRYIQEGMIGFQYRPVSSPKYGKLQYWVTYQFVQRNLWSGIGSATTPTGPRAQDNMIHVSMRYYIP